MITVTSTDDAPLRFNVHVAGVAAYLDNFALIELAKPSHAARRERFMMAFMKSKGSLLFSGTNGAELSALKGDSASNVRAFLDGFGAHWAFVELDPGKVMRREAAGQGSACLCTELMHAFFENRKSEVSKQTSILDMSASTFLRLGSVIDWMGPHGSTMIENAAALDDAIIQVVDKLRVEYETDPTVLNIRLPPIAFNPKQPATFAWNHLVRGLVINAKGHPPKKGDGRDLCHAVMGAAYGSFAALDKQWKKRVAALPEPNGLAKIYYSPELDQLVADLESHAKAWQST
jgi:hypothetical protein